MTGPRVKKIYTYDSRNRLSTVRYENGVLVTFSYDPVGNLTGCRILPSPQLGQTTDTNVICTGCGNDVPPGQKFCSRCGVPVSSPLPTAPRSPAASQTPSVCPSCGSPLKAGIMYCGDCGRHL